MVYQHARNTRYFLFVSLFMLLLSACGANKRESIVIYTNAGDSGRGDWMVEQWNKAGFDFDITYITGGGGDIANRLIAEKNNPLADVVFGLNDLLFEQILAENTLEPYVPSWAGDVLPIAKHPEGYHHGVTVIANVLVYNSALYNVDTAPKDWPDLWNNPAFHNLYEIKADLGQATTRNILAGLLTRYREEGGVLGVSAEGWSELAKYYRYGVPTRSQDIKTYSLIASGDIHFAQMWSGGIPADERLFGVTTAIVNPPLGIPYVTEGLGVVRGSKKVEMARQFIDWFGSEEIQRQWTVAFDTLPANQKAVPFASDFAKNIADNYPAQPMDWAWIAKYMNQWVEKIELEFVS
jgi:iron(III) transport system substrate-binding protein